MVCKMNNELLKGMFYTNAQNFFFFQVCYKVQRTNSSIICKPLVLTCNIWSNPGHFCLNDNVNNFKKKEKEEKLEMKVRKGMINLLKKH